MTRERDAMRLIGNALLATTLAATMSLAQPLAAQSLFSPVIMVNEQAVTGYEIDQRIRLLQVFGVSGDLAREARTQLVEDRLKQIELDRSGLRLNANAVTAAMEEFAGRANLTLPEFLGRLASAGVAEETLRDYVAIGTAWRELVRARYNSRVTITDDEIDNAIALMGSRSNAIDVLLSEIILPAPPQFAREAAQVAEQISAMRSTAAFEAAAREYSALPSREAGGRLDWMPLTNLPQGLHGLITGLENGEVTPPIPIDGGIALFQMRGTREGRAAPVTYASIDYAVFHTASAADAQRLIDNVDVCDDLYTYARDLPQDILFRGDVAPGEIPQGYAVALASLDRNEATTLPAGDGRVDVVMLCNRTPTQAAGIDRAQVELSLRAERLTGYGDGLVQELRSSAAIVGE